MAIVNWIKNLFLFRYINATLYEDNLTVHANAECPQGGVLSGVKIRSSQLGANGT